MEKTSDADAASLKVALGGESLVVQGWLDEFAVRGLALTKQAEAAASEEKKSQDAVVSVAEGMSGEWGEEERRRPHYLLNPKALARAWKQFVFDTWPPASRYWRWTRWRPPSGCGQG